MATKRLVEGLKRRTGAALLRTPGVAGVGVGRRGDNDYVLDVYVVNDDAATRQLVISVVGADQPVRVLRSGRFHPQ